MSIGLRIAKIRNDQQKNIFAKELGITADYLRMLESNEKRPGKTLIKLICQKFNISEEWLATGTGDKHTTPKIHLSSSNGSKSHLLSINVYNFDDISDLKILTDITSNLKDKTPLTLIVPPEGFESVNVIALKVPNNAMEPNITKNSIVGVSTDNKVFEEGNPYLVKTPESDILIRRIYIKRDSVLLISNNNNFPEIEINRKYLKDKLIIGKILWAIQCV